MRLLEMVVEMAGMAEMVAEMVLEAVEMVAEMALVAVEIVVEMVLMAAAMVGTSMATGRLQVCLSRLVKLLMMMTARLPLISLRTLRNSIGVLGLSSISQGQ